VPPGRRARRGRSGGSNQSSFSRSCRSVMVHEPCSGWSANARLLTRSQASRPRRGGRCAASPPRAGRPPEARSQRRRICSSSRTDRSPAPAARAAAGGEAAVRPQPQVRARRPRRARRQDAPRSPAAVRRRDDELGAGAPTRSVTSRCAYAASALVGAYSSRFRPGGRRRAAGAASRAPTAGSRRRLGRRRDQPATAASSAPLRAPGGPPAAGARSGVRHSAERTTRGRAGCPLTARDGIRDQLTSPVAPPSGENGLLPSRVGGVGPDQR
jgi:hypothetical protein